MSLKEELDELDCYSDPHKRGNRFETFLAHMLKEEGFKVTSDPDVATPLQTDLSARRGQTYFLVEAKWLRKPLYVGDVSAVRERLRNTPPDVFACVFSMSGYGEGAIKEACRERTREILLFNGAEIRSIAAGKLSFDELLSDKRDVLRTHADVCFRDGEPSVVGSSYLRSGPDVIQVGDETRQCLLCNTGRSETLFCRERLDFTARYGAAVLSINLPLDLGRVPDLERVLRMAGNQLVLANESSFSIHQGDVGWFGFGLEDFIAAVKNQQSRYAQLNWDAYHHSEELGYIDRIQTGGLFCLSSRQSTHERNRLHASQAEILLPGIPVEMDPIRRFSSWTGNPEAVLEAFRENPVKKCAFRPKVVAEPVGTIVSDWHGEKTVSGLVVKNPFLRGRPPFALSKSVEEPFWLLSKHEFLLCSLRSWHNPGVLARPYELLFAEGCWIGNYAAFWIVCDWI